MAPTFEKQLPENSPASLVFKGERLTILQNGLINPEIYILCSVEN